MNRTLIRGFSVGLRRSGDGWDVVIYASAASDARILRQSWTAGNRQDAISEAEILIAAIQAKGKP